MQTPAPDITPRQLEIVVAELRTGTGGLCWIVVHPNGDLVVNRPIIDANGNRHLNLWRVTREQAKELGAAGATWQGPPDLRPF